MSTLRDLGYAWASLPSTDIVPLQLLMLTGADAAEQMNTSLQKLFIPKNIPVPLASLDMDLPSTLNLSQKMDGSVASNVSFLQNLLKIFSGDAKASFSWEKHSAIDLVLSGAKKQVVDLIDLDTYIQDATVNANATSFVAQLKSDKLYVITEIIKTNSFTISMEKGAGWDAAVEVPTQVASGKVKIEKSNEGKLLMSASADKVLTVAVRAVRIFFDKPGFLSGKPGKFRLSSNENLVVMKGVEDFPAENLSSLFIQPEAM